MHIMTWKWMTVCASGLIVSLLVCSQHGSLFCRFPFTSARQPINCASQLDFSVAALEVHQVLQRGFNSCDDSWCYNALLYA